jgi:hypothetical protein
MIFRTGYLTVGRCYGAPLRIHWTTPIGAYVFTGADYPYCGSHPRVIRTATDRERARRVGC